MMLSEHERRLLGAFLRARRERLPASLASHRAPERPRRTPGLRREEVADLCGISPTWYAWIEQGRDISVSAATLGRLALALHLSPAERAYLFALARQRDPSRPEAGHTPEEDPVLALRPVLSALSGPAYLLDPDWQAAAWNEAGARLFGDWFGIDGRSLLDFMFLDPRSRRLVPNWAERARRLAAEFRADVAGRPNDPALRATIDRLRGGSAEFLSFWDDQGVLAREGGLRLFDHPALGRLSYTQTTLHPAAWPSYKLVVLTEARDPASSAP